MKFPKPIKEDAETRRRRRAHRRADGLELSKPLRSARRKEENKSRTKEGHEYLIGWKDNLQRRSEVYALAGGEVQIEWEERPQDTIVTDLRSANCQGCAETHIIGWVEGHWDHGCAYGGKKCSTLAHNQTFKCRDSHEKRHGRFWRKQDA